ncbi:MAG: alcohol dehydrogenase catalytic domain-containing protein [Opitutales bacterium]
MQAQAVLFEKPQQVGFGAVEIPEPGPGELLVANRYTCISPGTELRCLAGLQANIGDKFPLIPGYAACGEVIQAGPETTLKPGTRVRGNGTQRVKGAHRVWGGHCSHMVIAENAVQVVPEGLDLKDAVLCRLAAIAYRGVRLAELQPHHTVVVIGLGAIGQFSARLHHACGNHVLGLDQNPKRVDALTAVGIPAKVVAGEPADAVNEYFGRGADCVVDATGAAAVIPKAAACLRELPWMDTPEKGPVFIVQGSYPASFEVPYQLFFGHETTIRFPRDCQRSDLETTLRLASTEHLIMKGMITDTLKPQDATKAYQALQDPLSAHMTIAFDWS